MQERQKYSLCKGRLKCLPFFLPRCTFQDTQKAELKRNTRPGCRTVEFDVKKKQVPGTVSRKSSIQACPHPIVAQFGGVLAKEAAGAEAGSDVRAVADGKISMPPVHLDLTAYALMPSLKEWDKDRK